MQPLAWMSLRARYTDVPLHAHSLAQLIPPCFRSEVCRIGLAEALSNAIIHGALGVPSSDDRVAYLDAIAAAERSAAATVRAVVSVSGEECEIEISDEGSGFDWRRTEVERGRGLGIVKDVFASVSWNDEGNVVRLRLARAA